MLLGLMFGLGVVAGLVVGRWKNPPVDPAPFADAVRDMYGQQRSPDTSIPVHPVNGRPKPPKVVR